MRRKWRKCIPKYSKLPKNIWWHPERRCLVRVSGSLVAKAQDCEYTIWGTDDYVDSQEFIIMAGAEVFLLAGLLGLGLGYLISSRERLPAPGYSTKVIPNYGKSYTGPWRGIDPSTGTIQVGNREYDPDQLRMVGPNKNFADGRSFVDLNNGFVNPDELAKLKKAHNRNGYHRRKKV